MDSVEQTFDLRAHRVHQVGRTNVVVFRGKTIDVYDLATELGLASGEPHAAVIVWAGGRRRVFAVEGLVGQMLLERHPLPPLVRGRYATSAVLLGEDVVPVLEPGAVVGAWEIGGSASAGFSELQESALIEVANIG